MRSSRQDILRVLNPSTVPLSWRSEGFGKWFVEITHLIEFTLVFSQVSRDVRGNFLFPYEGALSSNASWFVISPYFYFNPYQ